MYHVQVTDFEDWRTHARAALAAECPPYQLLWSGEAQDGLFNATLPPAPPDFCMKVNKHFVEAAKAAACFRSDDKWALLYRMLWRLTHEEPYLLKITTDDDVIMLNRMVSEVRRDSHKMKAFVRFREVAESDNAYIAWHQPSHLIVKRTAPFFTRRFAAMRWAILTPDLSAYWDGHHLGFGEGLPRSAAPVHDELEALWKTFYRNIFNPARIKTQMMKSEMPVKYWHTMPETALIPHMLEEADKRVQKMIEDSNKTII